MANIVANPFDVIKSRMQSMTIDANGKAPYKSMTDCFAKSIKSEGFLVLWSGFTPAFVKLGKCDDLFTTTVIFSTSILLIRFVCRFSSLQHHQSDTGG